MSPRTPLFALAVAAIACKEERSQAPSRDPVGPEVTAPTSRAASAASAASGATAPSPRTPPASANPAHLEAMLEPIRAAHGLPALAAAVLADERVLALGAVGVRKLGDPTPVTIDDHWHLGSDTKAMTATLVALFVDAKKLAWTTTLAEAFPAWAKTMNPAFRAVTLEMLLTHWGGAPPDVPPDLWALMWQTKESRAPRLVAVRGMLERAPSSPPGSKFAYSNAGYMIVGAALEQAADASWEELMKTRLFAPLGISACGFGAAASPGVVDQPWGHAMKNGELEPVPPQPAGDNPPSLGPAGTVHCSLRDWGKFLAAHLRGGRGERTLVSTASMTKLHTAWPGGDYAMGWRVTARPAAGGVMLTHSGSNTMSYATAWLLPQAGRAVLVATNRGDPVAGAAVGGAFAPLLEAYGR